MTTEYECPDCKDRELQLVERDGSWVGIPCHCREAKALRRMFKSSGLTPEQRGITLDQFKPSKQTANALWGVRQYITDFPDIAASDAVNKGLALMGTVGTGKTHLLLAITNTLLERRVAVMFVYMPDLVADLRDAQFDRETSGESGLNTRIRKLGEAPVVVFDDVGKERITDWVAAQYDRILDQRYRRRLPTLFSSNLDMDEIAGKIGDAAASRLYALTRDRQYYVKAADYRVTGRREV